MNADPLARGVELFDAARYEEAHEAFEELWLASESGDADFFKGLIQACIALHHFQRGNLDGARKLYSGHRRLLAAFLPQHRGIDVERLLALMQEFLRPCLRARPGEAVPFRAEAAPRMPLRSAGG
jgi:predicted metal-dependent hydrolase